MTPLCDPTRLALSARMDGEASDLPGVQITAHLSDCAACRSWQVAAERATRQARVQAVEVPDLTEQILAAATADSAAHLRARRRQVQSRRIVLQVALAVTALVQLALAVPALLGATMFGSELGDGLLAHTSREAASLDIALAVGFLLAAWRPQRAAALVPVAVVLAACFALTSAYDLGTGATTMAQEIGHLAALAQAGLLWLLSSGPRTEPSGALRVAI